MDASGQREVDALIEGLLVRVASAIERDARRFAPVDTGDLERSIHAEEPHGRTVRVVADAVNDSGDGYASYVEDGTSRMAAQPYLKPALYRERALS